MLVYVIVIPMVTVFPFVDVLTVLAFEIRARFEHFPCHFFVRGDFPHDDGEQMVIELGFVLA